MQNKEKIVIGSMVYWSRIRPNTEEFDVIDLQVSKKYEDYFACTDDSSGQRCLFSYGEYNRKVFGNRYDALQKSIEAEEKFSNQLKREMGDL